MATEKRHEPDKTSHLSRRRFLRGMAVGAGAVAATAFTQLDLNLKRTPEVPAAAGPAASYAFTARAGETGTLLRWGKPVQAAEQPPRGNTHNRVGPPYHVSPERQWVMVIDLAKCNGCGDCQVACDTYHRVPPGQEWIKIYRLKDTPNGTPYWFPRVCMQCDSAPCVKVCPVGATYKREDGIVMLDQDRCIGCRFCIAACPYSARYFDWSDSPETPAQKAEPYDIEKNTPHRKGVAEKCLFCPELLREGKLPSCAQACTMNAIYFGDRNEDAVTNRSGETLKLSDLLKEGAYRFHEDLGTEPRVYYLPPRGRKYDPPAAGAET